MMNSNNGRKSIHHLTSLAILILVEELFFNTGETPIHWDRERLDWRQHVELKLFENRFHVLYRMDYESFFHLYKLLLPYMNRDLKKSRSNHPISKMIIMACGVRYLAGEKLRSLESDLQISKSTSYEIREVFIDAVLNCPDLAINFPRTTAELSYVANGFAAKASEEIFKGCIGAIDGFFAPTEKPSKSQCNGNQRSYYSGHYRLYGLNVQAVVDSECKYLYFGVIGPGSMNDCRSYQKSGLKDIIDNLPSGFYLVGDAAYPLSDNLLIPFIGSQRSDKAKDAYNFYLSQLRIRVEMSFGRLVRKWAILQSKLCCNLKMNSDILVACARLHNFVIERNNVVMEPVSRISGMQPTGFEYLPTRIEDREDSDSFIASSAFQNSTARDIIVEYIDSQNFIRPRYNMVRNTGNVDLTDANVLYYTVV